MIELITRTVRGPYVTMSLQGVGVADVTQVKATLDELFDLVESSVVWQAVVKVADHAYG